MDSEIKLGELIGLAVDNFSITNDGGDKVQLKITFDYTTASNMDIVSWLNGNRRIAGQRPWRAMSKSELEELSGSTIIATEAGKKVKTKAEKVKEARAVLAALKASDPDLFNELTNRNE